MNHAAIDYTARIAAAHRVDVAAGIAAARATRRVRHPGEPTVTEVPRGHRGGWWRWMPLLHPVH